MRVVSFITMRHNRLLYKIITIHIPIISKHHEKRRGDFFFPHFIGPSSYSHFSSCPPPRFFWIETLFSNP